MSGFMVQGARWTFRAKFRVLGGLFPFYVEITFDLQL